MRHQIAEIKHVQQGAQQVLAELASWIGPASTEKTIAGFATRRLREIGFPDTWYYQCPALVLLGSRSCLSPSGRDYVPSDEKVGELNLITVDLSPCRDQTWGDCARSFFVESGEVVESPCFPEFQYGLHVQRTLHREMLAFARPDTKCNDLYQFAMDLLVELRCENLDASDNFGHSICTKLSDRRFLAEGIEDGLGDFTAFTFEPHIRTLHGSWGFKHENIYCFNSEGTATEV